MSKVVLTGVAFTGSFLFTLGLLIAILVGISRCVAHEGTNNSFGDTTRSSSTISSGEGMSK